MRPGARDACARPSSDRRAPWITAAARAHGEFGVDVIDLRDWELPLFGEDGQPRDHRARAAAKILLDDLAWWASALRQARSRGTLPPAIVRLAAGHELGK
jgi:hypothetical protein